MTRPTPSTSEYYENLLEAYLPQAELLEAHPPEAGSYLPPAKRPKNSSSVAHSNGSQWSMNPLQHSISTGQGLAMIAQAIYLETHKPPSGVSVIIFQQGEILQSMLVPREIEREKTVLEAMNLAEAMNSRLFMCKSPTSGIQLDLVLENGDKIPMTKENYKTWTISDLLSIRGTPSNAVVTLEISEIDLGSDDTSDNLHSDDLEDL
jgi:hypothetical protein